MPVLLIDFGGIKKAYLLSITKSLGVVNRSSRRNGRINAWTLQFNFRGSALPSEGVFSDLFMTKLF
jgi:hypothetical protein